MWHSRRLRPTQLRRLQQVPQRETSRCVGWADASRYRLSLFSADGVPKGYSQCSSGPTANGTWPLVFLPPPLTMSSALLPAFFKRMLASFAEPRGHEAFSLPPGLRAHGCQLDGPWLSTLDILDRLTWAITPCPKNPGLKQQIGFGEGPDPCEEVGSDPCHGELARILRVGSKF